MKKYTQKSLWGGGTSTDDLFRESLLVDIRANLWWAMLYIVTFIADIISLMFSDNKKWWFHFFQLHDHRQNRKFPKRNVVVAKPLIWVWSSN